MSGLVSLKSESWDFNKGKFEEVDSWPLMASPGPAAIILASYLIFVLKVGPKYMENRQPFQLKWLLVVYNFAQVVFSAFLAAKCFSHIVRYGLVHSKCIMQERDAQKEVSELIWWYLVAKVTEFVDTVFFVLRKKNAQLSFLHIYHHSVMMSGTWALLKYGPNDHVVFAGFLNSFVHVIMYAYYGLSALGPSVTKYLWWKKYLTRIQLIQFCALIIHLFLYWINTSCKIPQWTLCMSLLFISSFLVLFVNFYIQAYLFKKKNMKRISKPLVTSVDNIEDKEEGIHVKLIEKYESRHGDSVKRRN